MNYSAAQECIDALEARDAKADLLREIFKKEEIIIGGIKTENLDKIDWSVFRDRAKWPMRSGQTIKLKNMKSSHLNKVIKHLERIDGDWSDEITIFKMELNFRGYQKFDKE